MFTQKTSLQTRKQGNEQNCLLQKELSIQWLVHMKHGAPLQTCKSQLASKRIPMKETVERFSQIYNFKGTKSLATKSMGYFVSRNLIFDFDGRNKAAMERSEERQLKKESTILVQTHLLHQFSKVSAQCLTSRLIKYLI